MSTMRKVDETRIAEEIVSVLPAGTVVRVCSDDRQSILYAVRAEGCRLQSIVFSRKSLQRLAIDPACDVKVEYLRRDLAAAAAQRTEFRYPRVSPTAGLMRRLANFLPDGSSVPQPVRAIR